MIKLECNEGHCELVMSGSGATIAAETQTIIRAVYDAIMKSTPDITHHIYGNMYRHSVVKAACDCTEHETP